MGKCYFGTELSSCEISSKSYPIIGLTPCLREVFLHSVEKGESSGEKRKRNKSQPVFKIDNLLFCIGLNRAKKIRVILVTVSESFANIWFFVRAPRESAEERTTIHVCYFQRDFVKMNGQSHDPEMYDQVILRFFIRRGPYLVSLGNIWTGGSRWGIRKRQFCTSQDSRTSCPVR